MALGDSYITAYELKEYARIADSSDDDQVTSVVNAVSRTIERYCGRQFNDAGSASARVFQASRADRVRVDDFSTTTGLVVKSDTALDGTYGTTIAASSYDVTPFNGVVEGQPGNPYRQIVLSADSFIVSNRPTVEITAQWGWAAVPADVKQAALIQAARIFGRRESAHGVLGFGDYVVRVSNRLDTDVEGFLDRYRISVRVA